MNVLYLRFITFHFTWRVEVTTCFEPRYAIWYDDFCSDFFTFYIHSFCCCWWVKLWSDAPLSAVMQRDEWRGRRRNRVDDDTQEPRCALLPLTTTASPCTCVLRALDGFRFPATTSTETELLDRKRFWHRRFDLGESFKNLLHQFDITLFQTPWISSSEQNTPPTSSSLTLWISSSGAYNEIKYTVLGTISLDITCLRHLIFVFRLLSGTLGSQLHFLSAVLLSPVHRSHVSLPCLREPLGQTQLQLITHYISVMTQSSPWIILRHL